MADYLQVNSASWNKKTEKHIHSEFYDVSGFKKSLNSLKEIELGEMPDVKGKELLHLQCHFGLDTLSWAVKGARVTGVDFSDTAIHYAKELAGELKINADFICDDIYSFGEKNGKKYDIVYTSYGVLSWLPSISQWANLVSGSLKTGGIFYMAEFHPLHDLLIGYPYFYKKEPVKLDAETYTENSGEETNEELEWTHPFSSVLDSLIKAGLMIQSVREYPFSPYPCFSGLEEREPGRYYFMHRNNPVPLVYTIRAVKT
ncbi:MAG: class I SAM-dependent methyltransferase [Fibrobacter sp.]|jgi:SAM-dependent methyltransferase|nr:class I SAM-dependent methyltransferase [Fibrobacter sp.]